MKILHNLEIEKLVHGGCGLAHSSGETVFVQGVLTGETVNAVQIDRKRGVIFAASTDILKPSPDRNVPGCPYFLSCGGCDWQHISHSAQIREKKQILEDCFKRIGKIRNLPEIETIAADQWKYRIRVQFKIDQGAHGIGFFRHNSHQVIDIAGCPLLDDSLDRLLVEKQEALSRLPASCGELKAIAGNDAVASAPVLDGMTREYAEIIVAAKTFKVSGSSFFQANKYLHYAQAAWAKDKITLPYCIDLYGGAGFFSCLLGDLFTAGALVEYDKNDAALATDNLALNRIAHFKVIRGDADHFDASTIRFPAGQTCMILDPPRTGLSQKVLQRIIGFNPGQILSISCDPSTHARDIGVLVSAGKHRISHAVFFDLYPQTHHIESGVLLTS